MNNFTTVLSIVHIISGYWINRLAIMKLSHYALFKTGQKSLLCDQEQDVLNAKKKTLQTNKKVNVMALASASLFTRQAKVEKTEVTIVLKTEVTITLDSDLTDRVKDMKARLKKHSGHYFSLSRICEIAIENALKQAERELSKACEDGDEITML